MTTAIDAASRGSIGEVAIVAAILSLLPLLLALLADRAGWLRDPAGPTAVGVGILSGSKFIAILAFGAGRGLRRDATAGERAALIEAVTLGALIAFVASLALGGGVILPRALLLIDWAGTVGIIVSVRRRARRPDQQPAIERIKAEAEGEADPAVAAMIRDRRLLLTGGDRRCVLAIVREFRAFSPKLVLASGLDRKALRGAGSVVIPIPLGGAGAAPACEMLVRHRPSMVILAPGRDDPIREVALGTRRLVGEALRAGVEAFVLVVPDGGPAGHRLAERILRALSGLSRARLIRIRLGEGVEASRVAMRILKIAARGQDGAIVTLGRSGGIRFQPSSDETSDAGALWEELDRLESGPCPSRPS